jgi:hypothetical protein
LHTIDKGFYQSPYNIEMAMSGLICLQVVDMILEASFLLTFVGSHLPVNGAGVTIIHSDETWRGEAGSGGVGGTKLISENR